MQRKNEKMLNCHSCPGEANFAWTKIGGAYWNGFARASLESLGQKLRVSTEVFSPGRNWSRLGKDLDDVKLARAKNISFERKLKVPIGVFSPGRNWSRLSEDLDDVKLARAKNITFEQKLRVPTGLFSPGRG